MEIEERYDRLRDAVALTKAANYALNKELGTFDSLNDFAVKMQKNMSPSILDWSIGGEMS